MAPIPYKYPIITYKAPDRNQYDSDADLMTDSFQGHWSAVDATGMNEPDLLGYNPNGTILAPAHCHLDIKYPRYGRLSEAFTVPFTIKLFHTNGQIAGVWGGNYKGNLAFDWFWDETQSATPPVMVGDPMGLKQWTGRFSVAPRPNFHGFDNINLVVQVNFNNKDIMYVQTLGSYFNDVDPNAPITIGPQGAADIPVMGSIASPIAFGTTDAFGDNEVFVQNYLPTVPLEAPWILPPTSVEVGYPTSPMSFTNSYGGSSLLNTKGSAQTRLDLNFHAGIPGTIVSEVDQAGIIPAPVNINNTGIPQGAHQYGIIRYQPENSIPTNGVATLIVIQVPAGVAPPPVSVTVPNVIGLTQMLASSALVTAGLTVGVVTSINDMAPKGNVINQNPIAGTMVNQGSPVDLTVSLGPIIPPPNDDGILIGTINKKPDGTTCVCGIKGVSTVTTDSQGNPCIILDKP